MIMKFLFLILTTTLLSTAFSACAFSFQLSGNYHGHSDFIGSPYTTVHVTCDNPANCTVDSFNASFLLGTNLFNFTLTNIYSPVFSLVSDDLSSGQLVIYAHQTPSTSGGLISDPKFVFTWDSNRNTGHVGSIIDWLGPNSTHGTEGASGDLNFYGRFTLPINIREIIAISTLAFGLLAAWLVIRWRIQIRR